jgi:transcription elongation GreA/GreB family factor
MSRAFVKETAQSAPPPERMVADGPNLVTAEGFAHIVSQIARIETALAAEANVLLRETLERDLRYWRVQQGRAEIVRPSADGSVAFGTRVTMARHSAGAPAQDGRRQTFRIVGEDEADPASGKISWRSPLAQALIGARPGDVVETDRPKGEIEILAVEN